MPHIDSMFPSRFVKASDLGGKDTTVTIREIVSEKVRNANEEKTIWVVYFQRARKGLILNKTLATQIAALYGPETAGWVNQSIVLYPTRIKAFGEFFEVIRVRPHAPKPPSPNQPSQPDDATLDDLDDLIDADEVDAGVPFDHRPIQSDEEEPGQSDSTAWASPLDAQAWAVAQGYTANAHEAQKLWIEAVRACHGFDRTKAPLVYGKYIELLRNRPIPA